MNFEITLSKIANIVMGQSPEGKTCNTNGIGFPLLNGPTEFGRKYPIPSQYTIDAKKLSEVNDLLFCVRGSTTGKMNWSDKVYAIGRGIAAIQGKNGYKNSFVRAVVEIQLKSLLAQATGSTFPNVSRDLLNELKIPFVSVDDAKIISEVIEPLEDKINLLHESNSTFESIAQTLFKSWFIDFDPVRAKIEGRQPEGMDAETATLFPDSFEESKWGLIPKGWDVKKIEELMALEYGKALTAANRSLGNVPVYGSGGIAGYHNKALVEGPSIIVGRKGTVGSLYWEDRPFFPIDTVFYVQPKVSLTYCYYLLKTLGLNTMNTDGAVPGLNRNNVYRLLAVAAPNEVISCFDKSVSLFHKKIFYNTEIIETLITLRNSLLPLLISGQLLLSNFKNPEKLYV